MFKWKYRYVNKILERRKWQIVQHVKVSEREKTKYKMCGQKCPQNSRIVQVYNLNIVIWWQSGRKNLANGLKCVTMRSPFTDWALQTGKAGIIQITALWMNSEVKLKTELISDELSVSVGWCTQQMWRQMSFSCFDDNTDTLFVASYGRKLTLKWRTAA